MDSAEKLKAEAEELKEARVKLHSVEGTLEDTKKQLAAKTVQMELLVSSLIVVCEHHSLFKHSDHIFLAVADKVACIFFISLNLAYALHQHPYEFAFCFQFVSRVDRCTQLKGIE